MKECSEMSSCVQGDYPRSMMMGGYQTPNHKIGPHSPPPAWQYPPSVPNQSLSLEDSGINSGTDSHSSPSGSEPEHDNIRKAQDSKSHQSHPSAYSNYSMYNKNSPSHIYMGAVSPRVYPVTTTNQAPTSPSKFPQIKNEPVDYEDRDHDVTLTANVPGVSETASSNSGNALKCLEMSVERNLNFSSTSPGISEHSTDDDRKYDYGQDEYDDKGLRLPQINSHGRMKTFKCKQCPFVANTKADFWDHQRQHIKPEKLLTCHKCPFVTEYKHHLEYHLRNHDGSKPFKCEDCDYTCVNKSMLNSHKKSHSNIYQYRCAQCSYVSKYCHSLKLHLRRLNHVPAMVLNPDGTPNPLPIIDVYGSRRGPKLKSNSESSDQSTPKKPKMENSDSSNEAPLVAGGPAVPPMMPLHFQQLMPQMQVPLAYSLIQQAMFYQNLERLAREGITNNLESVASTPPTDNEPPTDSSEVLDLSKDNNEPKASEDDPASKLETPSTSCDEDEESSTTMFDNVEVVQNDEGSAEEKEEKPVNKEQEYKCSYCSICFEDAVLYTMHMGYHGYKDPFACNMCGEKCGDKVSFFLHIARSPHS